MTEDLWEKLFLRSSPHCRFSFIDLERTSAPISRTVMWKSHTLTYLNNLPAVGETIGGRVLICKCHSWEHWTNHRFPLSRHRSLLCIPSWDDIMLSILSLSTSVSISPKGILSLLLSFVPPRLHSSFLQLKSMKYRHSSQLDPFWIQYSTRGQSLPPHNGAKALTF